MTVPFMQFSKLIEIPHDFLGLFFDISLPRLGYF